MTEAILHLSIPVRDLAAARSFYEDAMGCRVGRVRDDWLDVWFFGMQLTLQQKPDEVAEDQGVRHFGAVLQDEPAFKSVVERLNQHDVVWISEPEVHTNEQLSGKVGGKLADPSGNVIELKFYPPDSEYVRPLD